MGDEVGGKVGDEGGDEGVEKTLHNSPQQQTLDESFPAHALRAQELEKLSVVAGEVASTQPTECLVYVLALQLFSRFSSSAAVQLFSSLSTLTALESQQT